MQLIAEGKIVSRAICDEMLAILRKQQDRAMIPRLLPFDRERITVANKTGWDEEKTPDAKGFKGDVRSDAAFVVSPRSRYVIAICARKIRDKSPGVDNRALVTGARLSQMVYDYFTVPVRRLLSAKLLREILQLKNPQARHCRQVAVIRQQNRAPARQRRRNLDRVGRSKVRMEGSQLRRRTQLRSIDIDQTHAAAAREHLLISLGEWNVSRSVWDHEYFQQRQARGDRSETPFVDRCEDRIEHRQIALMLLDEVDNDDGIESYRTFTDLADQSHDLRSAST
jgi:hypothetical protein